MVRHYQEVYIINIGVRGYPNGIFNPCRGVMGWGLERPGNYSAVGAVVAVASWDEWVRGEGSELRHGTTLGVAFDNNKRSIR